tara:strand:- start:15849 stop:16013 length:165 start_codon:yes stop_codon:yes gene_type:complete
MGTSYIFESMGNNVVCFPSFHTEIERLYAELVHDVLFYRFFFGLKYSTFFTKVE